MSTKKPKTLIVLTGGGTAGHVMPHFALIPELDKRGWSYVYIGSAGMERELVTSRGVVFYTVAAGKLRRYFSLQNFLDFFKIFVGFFQSLVLLMRLRPSLVFSKGGFVSVPVCYAAALLGIPVVTHESDLSPGLATKLIARVASRVLATFAETIPKLPANRSECVGSVVRPELLTGERGRGLQLCGFEGHDPRPIVLFMGGSLGAQRINECLGAAFTKLKKEFRIIHISGRAKSLPLIDEDYKGFEFVGAELADIYACADLVVSRAGSNSIFEYLALSKPMLLIPLEIGSRGDQVDNAASFAAKGWAMILSEASMTPQSLIEKVRELSSLRATISKAQSTNQSLGATDHIITVFANTINATH